MTAIPLTLTDTEPVAARFQLDLFREASEGKKLSLVRSLSRTAIELSRLHAPGGLDPVRFTYGAALADQVQRYFTGATIEENTRMKSPPDLIAALTPVIDSFEALGVPYFLGGSVASSAHGVPRATADVDVVAALTSEHVKALHARLRDDFYADEPSIVRAITRRASFNPIHLATMLKVDIFIPREDLYYQEAQRRAVLLPLSDEEDARRFFFATREDILIAKLDWYRRGGEVSERQWTDILGILRVQQRNIDHDYLSHWALEKDLTGLLQRAIEEATLP